MRGAPQPRCRSRGHTGSRRLRSSWLLPPPGPVRASRNSLAGAGARWEGAVSSARTGAVLAEVMTLALAALALLAALRLTVMFLNRRHLAAWETAWPRVGPQWTEGRL
jgi:hypothetical protein